jgi:hypothetical protein
MGTGVSGALGGKLPEASGAGPDGKLSEAAEAGVPLTHSMQLPTQIQHASRGQLNVSATSGMFQISAHTRRQMILLQLTRLPVGKYPS